MILTAFRGQWFIADVTLTFDGVFSLGSGRGRGPVPWSSEGLPRPWPGRPGNERPGSLGRPDTWTPPAPAGRSGRRAMPGEGPGPVPEPWWAGDGVEKQFPIWFHCLDCFTGLRFHSIKTVLDGVWLLILCLMSLNIRSMSHFYTIVRVQVLWKRTIGYCNFGLINLNKLF